MPSTNKKAHCGCWTCEHVSCRQYVNKFWAYKWSNKPLPRCGKCLVSYCKHQWTSLASQEGTNQKIPGLEFPVDLPMWSLVSHQDEKMYLAKVVSKT